MTCDHVLFQNFLKHCQSKGITVWADPDLEKTKGSTGYWHGNDHISVCRKGAKCISIHPRSTDDEISNFVESSADMDFEMTILLHELGHWSLNHNQQSTSAVTKYDQEKAAWDEGEKIARDLGLSDFSIYYKMRDSALLGYKKGLGLEPDSTGK